MTMWMDFMRPEEERFKVMAITEERKLVAREKKLVLEEARLMIAAKAKTNKRKEQEQALVLIDVSRSYDMAKQKKLSNLVAGSWARQNHHPQCCQDRCTQEVQVAYGS